MNTPDATHPQSLRDRALSLVPEQVARIERIQATPIDQLIEAHWRNHRRFWLTVCFGLSLMVPGSTCLMGAVLWQDPTFQRDLIPALGVGAGVWILFLGCWGALFGALQLLKRLNLVVPAQPNDVAILAAMKRLSKINPPH